MSSNGLAPFPRRCKAISLHEVEFPLVSRHNGRGAPSVTDDELTAAIQEVQQRARSRVPQGSLGFDGVTAADLMPLVHARDAAEGKVAAIGSVNPRPPGLKNGVIQRFKRLASRMLDWHVREQVEF